MGALLGRVEEGAFDVQPQRCRAAVAGRPAIGHNALAGRTLLQRRGDDRRQEGGDAVLRQLRGHRPDGGRVGGEIVAESAVELQVDEAGEEQQAIGVDDLRVGRAREVLGRPDSDDAAGVQQHGAAVDALGGGVDGGVGDE